MRAKKTKRTKFNWLTKLNALVKRKRPLPNREHNLLAHRAADWPTCACGQLCKALPKDDLFGGPLDRELRAQGLSFLNHVEHADWKRALATFHRIEKRSAKLLREMEVEA